MRVFLDTNVLFSAFATRGLSADLFQLIISRHELVTGEFNLSELTRILRAKLNMPGSHVDDIDRYLRKHTIVPLPDIPADIPANDPDDRWVLASARVSGADVLVSGDRDLLDLDFESAGIRIMNPRQLWELLSLTPD